MAYTPENNPYIPGDPYSYDLKWIVDELKKALALYQPLHDEMSALQLDYSDFKQFVLDYFDNLDLSAEISEQLDKMLENGDFDNLLLPFFNDINGQIAEQNERITTLTARMDTFSQLPPGSTAGNAELEDIRIGADSATYSSAGNAVRAQIGDIFTDNIGMMRILEYLGFAEEVPLTFASGQSGASNPGFSGSNLFAHSQLIDSSAHEIFTIINLAPDTYRYTIRGYTGSDPENDTFVSGSCNVLRPDLTVTSSYSSAYSNTISAIYRNTVGIFLPLVASKVICINVRRTDANNKQTGDVAHMQRAIKMYKFNPAIKNDFLPVISNSKRTAMGTEAYLFGYGDIQFDTESNTISVTNAYVVSANGRRYNNPPFDFTGYNNANQQTIYFDAADTTIKITDDWATLVAANENVSILGAVWAANPAYPYGYIDLYTNLSIYIDGRKQIIYRDTFRNKSISIFGDSIAWGRTTPTGQSSYLLQTAIPRHTGIKATNRAVGGTCYGAGHRENDICKLVDTVDLTADNMFLFFAGTNDYGLNTPLGTLSDTPSNDDGNTFYSAVRYCIEKIYSANPYAEIGIVTPTFRNYQSSGGIGNSYTTIQNAEGHTLGDYCDALINIGKYYNIPVYDMRENSPINWYNYQETLEAQGTGSSAGLFLHPTEQSYIFIYNKIAKWIGEVFI